MTRTVEVYVCPFFNDQILQSLLQVIAIRNSTVCRYIIRIDWCKRFYQAVVTKIHKERKRLPFIIDPFHTVSRSVVIITSDVRHISSSIDKKTLIVTWNVAIPFIIST